MPFFFLLPWIGRTCTLAPERRTKIPVGSLIQDPFFFLYRKHKKKRKETLIEKPMFITREHHIHLYCIVAVVLLSSKRRSILIFGVPSFSRALSAHYKGSNVRVKVQRNIPILCSWDIFFFSFLTLIPGSMAQHSVILQTKPQFSCDETQPKTHSDLWYHQWRDEKQVQPQFPSLSFEKPILVLLLRG